ncbi:MAG TPA: VacB/RNase II family 3'-5' exoribonuclease, partial [Thermoanaerobaculia bacterium]|nr:VacB/RNase II family 3'-5' exoribonuclease [Thermoanaerobaculia bacterium]
MTKASIALPQRPPLHDAILDLLHERGSRLLGVKEIHERLAGNDASREEVERAVEELEQDGAILAVRGKRYSLLEFTPYHAGTIKVYNDGHGSVLGAPGEPEIYIDRRQLKGAMNADLVVVRVEKKNAKVRRIRGREYVDGEVIRILRRAHRTVVGRFHLEPKPYVVPFDARIDTDIFIAPDATMDAREGEMVNVEIDRYPDRSTDFASGRIVEVLGFIGDPGVDIEIVIRKHHIPHNFPEDVLREADAIAQEVPADVIAQRVDLRERNIVTIDGETAKDFDDAVEVQKLPNGNYLLGVHIADVSHYVTEGSLLDAEAFERATSVYFPGRAIPMLPERLSNGICSLNPKIERLTFTCEMEIDARGRFLDHKIYKSVIRTRERMTYTEVNAILTARTPEHEQRYGDLIPDFERMHALYEILRAKREQRGSIDFDLPEAEVILDESGDITTIRGTERNVAHRLIEEFMLAANETVARELV